MYLFPQILMLNNNTANEKLQRDERQGKMLLHTEFSLLSLLKNQKGVIQQHELFSVSEMLQARLTHIHKHHQIPKHWCKHYENIFCFEIR